VIHLLIVVAVILFVLWLLFHATAAVLNLVWIVIVILAVIDNGLVLMQVVSFWQEVLRGALLLVAVVFDELGRRSKDVRMRV